MSQYPICRLHQHPIKLICACQSCADIFCLACFQEHHNTHNHSNALILNQLSIDLFITSSNIFQEHLKNWLQIIRTQGYREVVDAKLSFIANHNIQDITINSAFIDLITDYLNLSQANLKFVGESRSQINSLYHPDFFRDIFKMLMGTVKDIVRVLATNISRKITQNEQCQSIFEFKASLIGNLDKAKNANIQKYRNQIFREFTQSPIRTQKIEVNGFSPTKQKQNSKEGEQKRQLFVENREVLELRNIVETLNKKCYFLENENANLKTENSNIVGQFQNLKHQISKLNTQIDNNKKQKHLSQKISSFELKNNQLQSQSHTPKEPQKDLNQKNQEFPCIQIDPNEQLLTEVVELEQDLVTHKREIKNLIAFINDLQARNLVSREYITDHLPQLQTVDKNVD